ncbi:hypothetical protein HY496_01710 [Candidatus Woesearchaeota archaeon]|nr:hypothetical protein [Candidatus Woesearchaeota archaeon]
MVKPWWKKLFPSEPGRKVDSSLDIAAVIEFLEDVQKIPPLLLSEMKRLEELEKESHIAKPGLLETNLRTQADVLEKIIKLYESLQNDTDINGLRVKRLVQEYLRRAQRSGLNSLVEQKRKNPLWRCNW